MFCLLSHFLKQRQNFVLLVVVVESVSLRTEMCVTVLFSPLFFLAETRPVTLSTSHRGLRCTIGQDEIDKVSCVRDYIASTEYYYVILLPFKGGWCASRLTLWPMTDEMIQNVYTCLPMARLLLSVGIEPSFAFYLFDFCFLKFPSIHPAVAPRTIQPKIKTGGMKAVEKNFNTLTDRLSSSCTKLYGPLKRGGVWDLKESFPALKKKKRGTGTDHATPF